MSAGGFVSRWARRKEAANVGQEVPPEPAPAAPEPTAALAPTPAQPAPDESTPEPPAPTLEDVAALRPGDDVSRFVTARVDEGVKRAALKKLFTDPHYNLMDGLDVYIDDYSLPDPIPMAMLRQLNQARSMGLFAAEEEAEARAASEAGTDPDTPGLDVQNAGSPTSPDIAPKDPLTRAAHEDTDLQLQPDDAAGRQRADERAGPDRV